jgi:hypothetical protein
MLKFQYFTTPFKNYYLLFNCLYVWCMVLNATFNNISVISTVFCKLAFPKIYLSLLFSPVKKRNVLCSGEHVKQNINKFLFGTGLNNYNCRCMNTHVFLVIESLPGRVHGGNLVIRELTPEQKTYTKFAINIQF